MRAETGGVQIPTQRSAVTRKRSMGSRQVLTAAPQGTYVSPAGSNVNSCSMVSSMWQSGAHSQAGTGEASLPRRRTHQ